MVSGKDDRSLDILHSREARRILTSGAVCRGGGPSVQGLAILHGKHPHIGRLTEWMAEKSEATTGSPRGRPRHHTVAVSDRSGDDGST